MSDKEKYEETIKIIKTRLPNFQVKFKDENLLQKMIGFILFWNKKYMTEFTTTMFGNVYFPSKEWLEKGIKLPDDTKNSGYREIGGYRRAWKTLWHEYIHLWRAKKLRPWFNISYLLPQILAVISPLSLLAIWFNNLWLICAATLIFLAPLPAYWRMKEELYAYTMSLALNIWRYGSVKDSSLEYIKNHFTGWNYYLMWPFSDDIDGLLEKAVRDIEYKKVFDYPNSEPFHEAYSFIK